MRLFTRYIILWYLLFSLTIPKMITKICKNFFHFPRTTTWQNSQIIFFHISILEITYFFQRKIMKAQLLLLLSFIAAAFTADCPPETEVSLDFAIEKLNIKDYDVESINRLVSKSPVSSIILLPFINHRNSIL